MKAAICKPLGVHFNFGCVGGLEHGICLLKVDEENKWSQNPPAEICCDAKDVIITPLAVYETQQAALREAENFIKAAQEFVATIKIKSGDTHGVIELGPKWRRYQEARDTARAAVRKALKEEKSDG